MKRYPTKINDDWVMAWIENHTICSRSMNLFERTRYFLRIWVDRYTKSSEKKDEEAGE